MTWSLQWVAIAVRPILPVFWGIWGCQSTMLKRGSSIGESVRVDAGAAKITYDLCLWNSSCFRIFFGSFFFLVGAYFISSKRRLTESRADAIQIMKSRADCRADGRADCRVDCQLYGVGLWGILSISRARLAQLDRALVS